MTDNSFYYSKNPDVESNPLTWNFSLLGNNLVFTSDNGVFSKHTVDYGSRVLIDYVDYDRIPAGKILDMGTGYGPIGIAIAKAFPKRQVDMVDVNEVALALAKKNAVANQVDNVKIFESNIYDAVSDSYAAIITNPPVRAGKQVVEQMISGARDHLVLDGTLTVVLQKKQGAPSAKKLMTQVFGNCQILKRDKGYYILQSIQKSWGWIMFQADVQYMKAALVEAQKAFLIDEVPIGAVVIHNGDIIGRGHNLREHLNDGVAHAEIMAIEEACGALNSWRLVDCDLYVTIEPCLMCSGAIINSRIDNVCFGARDPKAGAVRSLYTVLEDSRLNHRVNVIEGLLSDQCSQIMKAFFRAARQKRKNISGNSKWITLW